jgi:hypothetical protein
MAVMLFPSRNQKLDNEVLLASPLPDVYCIAT